MCLNKLYFKARWYWILSYLILSGIFSLVLFSFELPLHYLLYGMALSFVALCVLIGVDSYYYKKRMLLLEETVGHQVFPRPWSPIEDLYQGKMKEILEEKKENETVSLLKYRELEEYASTWTHQVKTPIAAMRLILQDCDFEEKDLLAEEVFKVDESVQMLLNYLRLEAPSNDYVFREVELDKLTKKTIRKYAPLFIKKKLAVEVQETHLTVITDEKWLSFLIEQVVINALKYTEKGKITLRLKDFHTLEICDEGVGIPKEDLPRIFEAGFTGTNGRIYTQSTGMGLALGKRVADALSVNLSVYSKVGEGTCVFLQFRENQLKPYKNVT